MLSAIENNFNKAQLLKKGILKEVFGINETYPGKSTGMITLCSYCKKYKDVNNSWERIERLVSDVLQVDVSHGICPKCLVEYYSDYLA